MGKNQDFNHKKIKDIPSGVSFAQHSIDLISSYAWKYRSINCVKLINFLEIEHMNHAGTENGNLKATYKQLEQYGINRRYIPELLKKPNA